MAGIEPASGRLTVAFPYQHGTHRIVSHVSVVSNEPLKIRKAENDEFVQPLVRQRKGVGRRGIVSGHLLVPFESVFQSNLISMDGGSLFESARRESNPHIRHGKAVGCRYITGAEFES